MSVWALLFRVLAILVAVLIVMGIAPDSGTTGAILIAIIVLAGAFTLAALYAERKGRKWTTLK